MCHVFSLITSEVGRVLSALRCSPQSEDASFHFDGSGYSVVEKTLRAAGTHIIMLFSSFSPNGLLLYLASDGTVRTCRGHWALLCILDCSKDI